MSSRNKYGQAGSNYPNFLHWTLRKEIYEDDVLEVDSRYPCTRLRYLDRQDFSNFESGVAASSRIFHGIFYDAVSSHSAIHLNLWIDHLDEDDLGKLFKECHDAWKTITMIPSETDHSLHLVLRRILVNRQAPQVIQFSTAGGRSGLSGNPDLASVGNSRRSTV